MIECAVPIFPGDDLRVAKEFHVDRLGFTVLWESTEDGKTQRSRRNGPPRTRVDACSRGVWRDGDRQSLHPVAYGARGVVVSRSMKPKYARGSPSAR